MNTKLLIGSFLAFSPLLFASGAAAQTAEPSNLPDEYLKNLKNYEFVNTQGMETLTPNRHSWMPSEHEDKDNWELPNEAEISRLKELGISFPDFSFITGTDTVAQGQKRQRTHTVEHILYAIPGDALSLYPYYGLEETVTRYNDRTDRYPTKNYLETFSHWYDYRNGGRVLHHGADGKTYDLLDFPADRGWIQISDNYGFYGGIYMSPGTKDVPTPEKLTVYEVATPEQYINAVNAINNANGSGRIDLLSDLDFNKYDVPMLGEDWNQRFRGVLNGNGHKIYNLTIKKDQSEVGLIRYADNGAMVCNLVIDSTCTFQGLYNVGLIAKFESGGLIVKNVTMNATVKGTRGDGDHCTGAILGNCSNNNTDNHLTFENLYIGGNIGNPDTGRKNNTVLCGWLATENTYTNTIFKNIVFKGNLYGDEDLPLAKYIRRVTHEKFNPDNCYQRGDTWVERHDTYSILYTNCYGDAATADPAWKKTSEYTAIEGWINSTTPPTTEIPNPLPPNSGAQLLLNSGHRPWHEINDDEKRRRIAGTSAVFYFPDNDNLGDEWMSDTKEYVIASDFSQTFEPDTHLNIDEMKVTEPVVAFRHIFRIRDGREQARQLYENNRDYIRQHQHKVSARANANFQIRLDFPLPTNWGRSGGVTNYYYKKADGSFDRVKQFDIRVLNGETRKMVANPGFNCGADIRMRRAWASDDKTHAVPLNGPSDGKYEYHTMLHINKDNIAGDSHYIVQILAKDDSGNILSTADNGDMVIMEYDITFLPEKGASLLTEADLYEKEKYKHARDAYMKEHYGEPMDVIDFDAYIKLNKLPDSDPLKKKTISYSVIEHIEGVSWTHKDFPVWKAYSGFNGSGQNKMQHAFYKWPLAWNRSTYSFGYNYRYDYNMYMLATHSENVPYHSEADNWKGNINGENGLYDRLYYKTKRLHDADPRVNVEQGYFYYVNAASDPGVSARLNFSIPCPGSRVIVSAWVAEMSPAGNSQDEPANLSFNFVAVMKNTNERVTLHNFITGYLGEKSIYGERKLEKPEQLGEWLNIYYSFVPRLAEFYNDNKTFNDVDHFELELAHNGMSSAGSDYAIDDIRAYVVPPFSEADHEGYACEDSPLDINMETSFETLLEKSGHAEVFEDETDEELSLYFAFVDKEIVDEKGNLQNAFVKAVMQDGEVKSFGTVKFNSNYRKNDRFLDAQAAGNLIKNKGYRYSTEGGDRMIRLQTTVAPGSLRLGKEYYVVFHPGISETDVPTEDDLASFFDLTGECSYNCDMTIRPSLKIKVDGIIQPEFDNISVCENQSPVIQVNVWSTDKEPVEVVKNAYFDWFDGTMNDFVNYRFKNYPASKEILMDENTDAEAMTLSRALEVFRFRYSDAETTVGIRPDASEGEDDELLQQWMLDIIDVASAPDITGKTRLLLRQASFVLPPVERPDNTTKTKAKVVAIPIIDLYPQGDYESVCPSPTEVGVHITSRTPILRHGLTGISYPENLEDVPLRVGLSQLIKGDGSTLLFSKKRLEMPVRETASSDGKDKAFNLVSEKALINGREEDRTGCILLAQTNDPEYRNLGTVNEANEETGHLLWVGEIKELKAATYNETTPERQYFIADFDDAFRFKEGYFYRMRYRFEEEAATEIGADDEEVCQGQDVFTIKVVPEYIQWTGDKNLSWDNDDNWRRVSAEELMKADAEADNSLFTDGANSNVRGYAPLSYTKVILNAPKVNENDDIEGETPWLYATKEAVEVNDDYSTGKTNYWTPDPICPESVKINSAEDMSVVGNPTSLIQYDMTCAVSGEDMHCRPWTANNCSEIHFLSGATIMGQQYLNYERAWVDIELDHSRWYLLSTPLQDIYAGDFYLPSANGRQETELFQEIRFDRDSYNRFAPAVYQRGWDKSEARVYEYNKAGSRNAAVKTFWSNVYNDVTEVYGEGTAFSIKTDISKVKEAGEKVLFRLPKADERYFYYSGNGSQVGNETYLGKTSEKSYKLNATRSTLTAVTANKGNYFLVGNPFMTHFDIKAFLKENKDILEQKYWLITEDGQIAGSVTDAGVISASPYPSSEGPQDPSVIAPMQGFFVKTLSPATSVTLSYNEQMMRRYDSGNAILTETTRGQGSAPVLKIISSNDGVPSSAALLIAGSENVAASADAFDNRELGVLSSVFTISDGMARSINFCSNAEATEIGLIADDETVTVLRFEGTENFDGLSLLDTSDNSVTPLEEVEEITVKGPAAGRFYLTSSASPAIAYNSLQLTTQESGIFVTDRAATGSLNVIVCDIAGRIINDIFTQADNVTVKLDKGMYIVKMKNGVEEKTVKINL